MVARTWEGVGITQKINRAAGRSIIGIGVLGAVETVRVTHKLTGTLARSVHVAPLMKYHDDDEEEAKNGADLMLMETPHATQTPIGPVVELGSWISYACVEWVGRMHPGVTQGVEMVRGARADAIVAQAFREEGLL